MTQVTTSKRPSVEPRLNPWLEDRLARYGRDGTVLDVGCGRGYWLEHMTSAEVGVLGVEPDMQRARVALEFGPVAAADATRLPVASASMQVVWCIHVLHHLPDPAKALAEMRRVLAPEGHLILAETVEDNPIVRIGRRVHPEWDGVHVHSRFTAAALVDLVRQAGLAVVDQRQHSVVSFAGWGLPIGGRRAWLALSRLEAWLPASVGRWGAHFECVATPG